MENLLVVNLDWKFKPTKHKYTLSFVKATKLTQLDTDSIPKRPIEILEEAQRQSNMRRNHGGKAEHNFHKSVRTDTVAACLHVVVRG
ncbi:hypothetical protein JHK85_054542 [Glycine max]|nr:hypothetical protein JHK85_054542 [Glycine max]